MRAGKFMVFVIGDAGDDDPGLVGERIVERGGEIQHLDRDNLPDWQGIEPENERSLVLMLGSARSVVDQTQALAVEKETSLVCDALASANPVLGICYGSQLLAHALGGRVKPTDIPEFGIHKAQTSDADLCPPGPWAYLHYDTFDLPPAANAFGRTPGGYTGFTSESRHGRALAWQFHPEVHAGIMTGWLDKIGPQLREEGFDTDYMYNYVLHNEQNLRDRTHCLVDTALAWLFPDADEFRL